MTIVLDTSAVVAIILQEEQAASLFDRTLSASVRLLPASCACEAYLVLATRLGSRAALDLEAFCKELSVTIVPLTAEHIPSFQYARDVYGKGRHKASLNFGDCLAYALARTHGHPLLYIGNDFALTDLVAA